MKIDITLDTGDVLSTVPERLSLAPSQDGQHIILVAAGQGITAFKGQLVVPDQAQPSEQPKPAKEAKKKPALVP